MPSRKQTITRLWGHYKATYIQSRVNEGYSLDTATEQWRQHRRDLGEIGAPPPISVAIRGHRITRNSPAGAAATPGQEYREDRALVEAVLAEIDDDDVEEVERTESVDNLINATSPTMATPQRPNVQRAEFQVGQNTYDDSGLNVTADSPHGGPVETNNAPGEEIGGGPGGQASSNNQFFRGFPKPNKRSALTIHEVTKEYRKPMVFASQFINDRKCEVTPTGEDWKDTGIPEQYKAVLNHDGAVIPYFYKYSAMDHTDWNMPNDCVAYKPVEYGFEMSNLRVIVQVNDKDDSNQVPNPPTENVRLWTFIDTDNDYGFPDYGKDYSFGNQFLDRDGIFSPDSRFLKKQQDRHVYLDQREFEAMLSPGWTIIEQTKTVDNKPVKTNKFTAHDPNAVYDMRQKEGYQELTASQANFGLKYKPKNCPYTLLPTSNTEWNVDWTKIWPNTRGVCFENTSGQEYTSPARWADYSCPITEHSTSELKEGMINFWNNKLTAKTMNYAGNKASQKDINNLGQHAYMPDSDNRKGTGSTGRKSLQVQPLDVEHVELMSQNHTTIDGIETKQMMTNRAPLYLLGAWPGVEVTTKGYKWTKIILEGTIVMTAKVQWAFVSGYPSHIPVGPGGVYTTSAKDIDNITYTHYKQPLQKQQEKRADRRWKRFRPNAIYGDRAGTGNLWNRLNRF